VYLECHVFEVSQYPGRHGFHTRRVYARHRAGVDEPGLPVPDVILHADVGGVAVPVAHQIVVAGAGERVAVVRQVGDEQFAPVKLQAGFLPVVLQLPAGFLHHIVQRRDIADVVAVYRVDGQAEFQRGAQGVDADQIAAMDHGFGTQRPRFCDGRKQRGGAVVAVGYDANFHGQSGSERRFSSISN
jgi:hypothetical protein